MNIEQANFLIEKYIDLKKKYEESKTEEGWEELKAQEQLCLEKFKYIVLSQTGRYKKFINYDDLNQEGMYALVRAMNSFTPGKGSWFWWAHKYVDTKVSRMANLHTTIKYPLKYARANPPKREPMVPPAIDTRNAYLEIEDNEVYRVIESNFGLLNEQQRQALDMFFGIGTEEKSVSKISKSMNVSREACVALIDKAVEILKENSNI